MYEGKKRELLQRRRAQNERREEVLRTTKTKELNHTQFSIHSSLI